MIPVSGDKVAARLPLLTILLMLGCIWAFVVVQPSTSERSDTGAQTFTVDYAAIPCEVLRGKALTSAEYRATFVDGETRECADDPTGPPANPDKNVYSAVLFSMFMHAGWVHLLGNMLSLWVFGTNVEIVLGRVRYLGLYLLGGIAATLGHVVAEATSAIPIVGASGAIAALMGAYLVMFPLSTVRVWFLVVIPMPAILFLAVWFGLQFNFGSDSAVAWMAHVTGFIAGVTAALLFGFRKRVASREFAPRQAE